MKRYQARPRWELDRAVRRRARLDAIVWGVIGGAMFVLIVALIAGLLLVLR